MKKVVLSGMIGNGLEWYDYALYGQMAWLIGKLFFPEGDAFIQMLSVYGVFAAGFVVRPLGAVFFGWLGDTYGRRKAMVFAILMMAIPTGCIGILPSYAQIGVLAPVLLTLIRLLQGLSLGGEFSGSITYIVEHAPSHKRGLAGAASLVSLILGFLLGLMVVKGMIASQGQAAFEAWGWRVPFLLGIIIGLVGFYMRFCCSESPAYEAAKEAGHISKTPIAEAFRKYPWPMLQGFAIYISVTMPFYLTTVYFIGFSQKHLGVSANDSLMCAVFNMLAMLAIIPFSAILSDHFGRKQVMMTALFAMLASTFFFFSLMQPGAPLTQIALAQSGFSILLGLYIGPVAALLVELFPTAVRFTGMAIAYNFAAAIFGGTAPLVCEWLLKTLGDSSAIAWYVVACNVASLVAFYFYKDRYDQPLH